MTATVNHRQTVFDLALQHLGSAEACFLVADRLGICVTDTPPPGAAFDYSAAEIADPHVAGYYARNAIQPTTENETDL